MTPVYVPIDGPYATEFTPFEKIARFSRDVIITEKIDGTNAQVHVSDDGKTLFAGSRTQYLGQLGNQRRDNFGFAAFVEANYDELLKLGPGRHYGEWWGSGIQRNYGLKEKRFSLFNVSKWADDACRPACCGVVPVLWTGSMDELPQNLAAVLEDLRINGSRAAPGFMKPEGVVIYHVAGGHLYKKTLEKDESRKSEQ